MSCELQVPIVHYQMMKHLPGAKAGADFSYMSVCGVVPPDGVGPSLALVTIVQYKLLSVSWIFSPQSQLLCRPNVI